MTGLDASSVAALLRGFGKRSALRGGNPFRAKAYAARRIIYPALSLPLETIIAQDRLQDVPGIGNTIADIIKKLFATGTHPALEKIWSANAGIKSLFDALNLVYNEEEKRGPIKLNLVSPTFTVAAMVFVLFGIAAVMVLPVTLNYIGLGGATDLMVRIGRWPILFILVAFALALDHLEQRFCGLHLDRRGLFPFHDMRRISAATTRRYGSLGAVIGPDDVAMAIDDRHSDRRRARRRNGASDRAGSSKTKRIFIE
jgi:Virulence factor BrkB